MQLSYLLSTFLAALTITSPLADPAAPAGLAIRSWGSLKRAVKKTDNYKKIEEVKSDLKPGSYYVFTQTWPKGQKPDADHVTPKEMQELYDRLGFSHIAVVVGQVTSKQDGQDTVLDFQAKMYDLVKEEEALDSPVDLEDADWKAPKTEKLQFELETTGAKAADATIQRAGRAYLRGHKIYNIDDNNCNTYAQYLLAQLK
ncbi:hypothetical protein F4778DRAFT_781119 [Xylariomycetidae sp. FL2044]|nr:hypothetical protein F4778DRAFT_781119 [Xylariomycetidae sp. FL2044]